MNFGTVGAPLPANALTAAAPHHIIGLTGCAVAWALRRQLGKEPRFTLFCQSWTAAESAEHDLRFLFPEVALLRFPPWDTLPFEPVSPQTHVTAERLRTLCLLSEPGPRIVLTSVEAVRQNLPPKRAVLPYRFTLAPDTVVKRADLIASLIRNGFRPAGRVEGIGEFAVRGGIVDLAPFVTDRGIRIEFVGDRIQSLREFEFESQRSSGTIPEAVITPLREVILFSSLGGEDQLLAISRLRGAAAASQQPPTQVAALLEAVTQQLDYPGIEILQPFLDSERTDFFSYLPPDEFVVALNLPATEQESLDLSDRLEERHARLSTEHLLPPVDALYLPHDGLMASLNGRTALLLNSLPEERFEDGNSAAATTRLLSLPNHDLSLRIRAAATHSNLLEALSREILDLRDRTLQVVLVSGSRERAERLSRLLREANLEAPVVDGGFTAWLRRRRHYPLAVVCGQISQGVQLPAEHIAFIAEQEIFAERSVRKGAPRAVSARKILSSLGRLAPDDYVVHRQYGIGLYRGLSHLTVEGQENDFLHIDYADSTLYIPVTNIGSVQKFTAVEGQTPKLDKLSSTRWTKTTQKVRESVASLAGDLIRLYAERSIVKGWRFEPAGAEDERFADGFPYQETADQLTAIEETLKDMSSDKPMDRLVCGDVGFGKTEIALRAAYKAVQHCRQVALLAPTTILVEQHLKTFRERFLEYPVKVGAVSRFYSAAQNRATLDGVATGEIDIVVGTHRLLQRDVVFRDLGLVIIDEEHRFGVQQKERLKSLKRQVDVLTLTATPIPRTLHMALLDVRDISVISSPPHNRQAIRTYLSTFDESVVRDAILRELQRGGQCYFIHNRVQTIASVAARLQALVPGARFEFAHGQMHEHELERIMMRFYLKEIDVLVATTIVESGLDVSNANTILIDRADNFGLAQLYQLRGRVGRSSRQAYAYFLIPAKNTVSSGALRRLEVLQALDDLGLGFQLALRDLEIRGAGNLLGKEQSGNVLAVGFELYTKILKEAVLHLKGDELPLEEELDPEINLGYSAYIPEHYVPDISERLILYQRLSSLTSDEEATAMLEECGDRFGPPPRETVDLIEIMRLRAWLRRWGVVRADYVGGKLSLWFSPRAPLDGEAVFAFVQEQPKVRRFSRTHCLSLELDPEDRLSPESLTALVCGVLERLGGTGCRRPMATQ